MLFETVTLDSINRAMLRLVTFASQSQAVAFVRQALAVEPDADGLLLAARMDDGAVASFRQAMANVAGMPRAVSHKAGESYTVSRGDRKGQTVTAEHTSYKPYTVAEYREACEKLNVWLVRDESTVTSRTDENGKAIETATYALQTHKPASETDS
jgi:hypothetical protein